MTSLHPKIAAYKKQQTYCMIKPDGVSRGLIGEIISRIEKTGLKIIATKMMVPTREIIAKHLPLTNDAWVERLGDRVLSTFTDLELNPSDFLANTNKLVVSQQVIDNLTNYLCSGPVVCMVVEGIQAIDMVRKLAGATLPFKAEMGTIRGDYSVDSPLLANLENRSIHNLFHASETPEEAQNEIGLWFTPEEINMYTRSGEDVMYGKTY